MLLDRGSWDDIESLEPIQQWCAYSIWDKRQWLEIIKMKILASASLGNVDATNDLLAKAQEQTFPYMAVHRADFEENARKLMDKLRDVKFRFKRAIPEGRLRRR